MNHPKGEQHAASQARPRSQLEHEIMSPSFAKSDREWWAMEEIEALRKVYAAARALTEECKGGDLSPSLGVLARLEDACHAVWRRSQK